MNWQFCSDKATLAWSSGGFARCLLSAISGHHGRIVALPRRESNNLPCLAHRAIGNGQDRVLS
jgi:hypothetical protein